MLATLSISQVSACPVPSLCPSPDCHRSNPLQVKNHEATEERLQDQKHSCHMNLMPFLKAE